MIKVKLKNPQYFLTIENGTTFNRTANLWQEGFKFPLKEESFSQSVPLQEIVDWGNNNVNDATTNDK
jgi:hypothetical protein